MDSQTPSSLDDSALATLCMRVLEYMNIGVVACNDEMVVLAATPTATRLLKEFDPASGQVGEPRAPAFGRFPHAPLLQPDRKR